MPNKSLAGTCIDKKLFDTAPNDSPKEVKIPLTGGDYLIFTSSGLVQYHPYFTSFSPEGSNSNDFIINTHEQGKNGISDIKAPASALLGVFLPAKQPDSDIAPSSLAFETAEQRNYFVISPRVNQVFFIGDGRSYLGIKQKVIVPKGATRFYLGPMDGCYWHDNTGFFDVEVTRLNFRLIPDAN